MDKNDHRTAVLSKVLTYQEIGVKSWVGNTALSVLDLKDDEVANSSG